MNKSGISMESTLTEASESLPQAYRAATYNIKSGENNIIEHSEELDVDMTSSIEDRVDISHNPQKDAYEILCENRFLKEQILSLRTECSLIRTDLSRLSAKSTFLIDQQIRDLKEARKKSNVLLKQNSSMAYEISRKNREIELLKNDYTHNVDYFKTIESKLRSEIDNLKSKSPTETTILIGSAETEEIDHSSQITQTSLPLRTFSTCDIFEYHQEIHDYSQENAELAQRVEMLVRQSLDSEQELENSKREQGILLTKIEKIRGKYQEIKSAYSKIVEAQRIVRETQEIEEDLTKLARENQILRDQNADLKAENSELKLDISRGNERFTNAKASVEVEIRALKDHMTYLSEKKVTRLKSHVSMLQEKQRILEKMLEKLNLSNQKLKKKLLKYKDRSNKVESIPQPMRKDLEQENQILRDQIAILEAKERYIARKRVQVLESSSEISSDADKIEIERLKEDNKRLEVLLEEMQSSDFTNRKQGENYMSEDSILGYDIDSSSTHSQNDETSRKALIAIGKLWCDLSEA